MIYPESSKNRTRSFHLIRSVRPSVFCPSIADSSHDGNKKSIICSRRANDTLTILPSPTLIPICASISRSLDPTLISTATAPSLPTRETIHPRSIAPRSDEYSAPHRTMSFPSTSVVKLRGII